MQPIALSAIAEKVKQILRNEPVSDINVVVRGSEAYVDAKPHPGIGGGVIQITIRRAK